MQLLWSLDWLHNYVHVRRKNVGLLQMSQVNVHRHFERVILQSKLEQLFELSVGDFFGVCHQEVLWVVLLGIHLQHEINFFWRHQESLSVILSDSFFDSVVDQQLFVKCLVVFSVTAGFYWVIFEIFLLKISQIKFCGHLGEGDPDKFIVTLLKEVQGVVIPHLDKLQLADNLRVANS